MTSSTYVGGAGASGPGSFCAFAKGVLFRPWEVAAGETPWKRVALRVTACALSALLLLISLGLAHLGFYLFTRTASVDPQTDLGVAATLLSQGFPSPTAQSVGEQTPENVQTGEVSSLETRGPDVKSTVPATSPSVDWDDRPPPPKPEPERALLAFSPEVPTLINLEEVLSPFAFPSPVDVEAEVNFDEYLVPNEGSPWEVKSCFSQETERRPSGGVVSTGTERSFFDLLFFPPNSRQFLVVRDINPRVKAYVDFNVLLLRTAKNVEEYEGFCCACNDIKFSPDKNTQGPKLTMNERFDAWKRQWEERFQHISKKIRAELLPREMPPVAREYYERNLEKFARVYYGASTDPRGWRENEYYPQCQKEIAFFSLLQRYARAGAIIATTGDIGDLEFLNQFPISVVDTSNIEDYSLIDLRYKGPAPMMIWTAQNPFVTSYFASLHRPLTGPEREELESLVKEFQQREKGVGPCVSLSIHNAFFMFFMKRFGCFSPHPLLSGYNQETLAFLREWKKSIDNSATSV